MQRRRLIVMMLVFDVLVLLPVVLLLVLTPGRGGDRVSAPDARGPFPLPRGFELGTAIAAQQVEHQQPSDWTVFERDAAANNRAEHSAIPGVATPGHIAKITAYSEEVRLKKSNFDELYVEDLKLARQGGHTSFRFSVDWARLFPEPGMTEPNPEAIAFYNGVFDTLDELDMRASVTLFHFSTPAWLWEERDGKRGFERDDALEHWTTFVRAVIQHFGPRATHWCTLNEPMVYLFNGYLEGIFPPLERRAGPPAVAPVAARLLEAHAVAYKLLHEDAAARGAKVEVGFTQHTRAFEPWRSWSPFDRIGATMVAEAFIWDMLDAVHTGTFALTNTEFSQEIPGLKGSQDYVGINYYGRFYVEVSPSNLGAPIIHPNDPSDPAELVNDLNWALYPRGLSDVVNEAWSRYGAPIYILENGVADANLDDTVRQYALVSHLRELSLLSTAGVDVRGYYHWSLVDNFEWAEGFDARFGLVQVNYADGWRRVPRESFSVYRQIAAEGGVSEALWAAEGAPPLRPPVITAEE
ncbi:family 1 glycosylhydrolase [Myxococcota bacterium]|nr:family 1 glycosylhydrolase [Myxococcota bacterium]